MQPHTQKHTHLDVYMKTVLKAECLKPTRNLLFVFVHIQVMKQGQVYVIKELVILLQQKKEATTNSITQRAAPV